MEAGSSPGMRARGVVVFDGVVVDVVEVVVEIVLVADGVFPETALPDGGFVVAGAGGGILGEGGGRSPPYVAQGAGEEDFEAADAGGVIFVGVGEGPEPVEMVGEDDGGVDGEGTLGENLASCGAEEIDVLWFGEER